MASSQSYKLLENEEPAEGEEGFQEENLPVGNTRRRFLESIPSLKTCIGYARERSQKIQDKVPTQTAPFCTPCTWISILSGMLVAVLILLLVNALGGSRAPDDVLRYIDPLIGTGPGGHVFAGATLPFGMAKVVADVQQENHAGYAHNGSPVFGFSSLHDSGTGGASSLGDFPLFIQPSCPNITACRLQKFRRGTLPVQESVVATPGYFSIELVSGVKVEMTAAERSSLLKFTFTNSTGVNPVVLADGSDLPGSNGPRTLYVDASTGRITAEGQFDPSFGQGHYHAYMCADFKGAEIQDYGMFNDTTYPGMAVADSTDAFYGARQGVYNRFKDVKPGDTIMARVGLSWLCIERACQNAEREIQDWDFDRLLKNAQNAWRKKMEPIQLDSTGVDESHLRNFWSGVYRAFINPQDYTGENQLWNSTEPYYDSWYCIWDTFRGVHPFYLLVDTVSQSRMVRSLIDIYKNAGWLPDCRMSFCKGNTQGGSNADVIIVDSFIKKLDGVNWTEGYAAIVKDAEEQPIDWDIEGRGGLESWKSLGYIPYKDLDVGGLRTRSVSRTVEYAYNDFCIAEMANATGRNSDYEKYAERASNWKNVIDWDLESMGFKGFPQPRRVNGTFSFQNATLCSHLNDFDGCYLNAGGHETYEGSPWLYLFYVPGDMAELAKLLGGRDAYLERLHKLHNSGVLYMGDEQAFLTAFLYHFAGRPGLSSKETHRYIPGMFNDTIEGIPGNDDSGSMGTFVFFSMLGIFPSAGQSVYFIIPPYFPSVSITNPQTGKRATIRNVNFDPTYKKIYVQSAVLDGKKYTKNWIDHNFFLDGGTLELVLGDTESEWGTKEEDLPPSLSTGLYFG
ncbi:related to alpha-1,2-mannosidase subfamily [Lecanosticta acicola]|uniref:Related to alpha-1,2-mannosidase subfamily n=1 Tax=Lecanosticta acicola TaxID=111012 RepID=A0AAI9EDT7_9PEZI|nr:related to alpha-1,2-mannosidase subfamily [Lecanosticta acicola]